MYVCKSDKYWANNKKTSAREGKAPRKCFASNALQTGRNCSKHLLDINVALIFAWEGR